MPIKRLRLLDSGQSLNMTVVPLVVGTESEGQVRWNDSSQRGTASRAPPGSNKFETGSGLTHAVSNHGPLSIVVLQSKKQLHT